MARTPIMLAAFSGETVSDVLAAVLREDPDTEGFFEGAPLDGGDVTAGFQLAVARIFEW